MLISRLDSKVRIAPVWSAYFFLWAWKLEALGHKINCCPTLHGQRIWFLSKDTAAEDKKQESRQATILLKRVQVI